MKSNSQFRAELFTVTGKFTNCIEILLLDLFTVFLIQFLFKYQLKADFQKQFSKEMQ